MIYANYTHLQMTSHEGSRAVTTTRHGARSKAEFPTITCRSNRKKKLSEILCHKVNEVTLPPWLLCLCHSAFYGELEAFNWLWYSFSGPTVLRVSVTFQP